MKATKWQGKDEVADLGNCPPRDRLRMLESRVGIRSTRLQLLIGRQINQIESLDISSKKIYPCANSHTTQLLS